MKYVIVFLITFISISLLGQDTATMVKPDHKNKNQSVNRVYYGGNFGLSMGSYTMIGAYPLVGFKVTPKLSAGVKLAYEYIQDKRFTTNYNTSNYGASLFARYRVLKPLYVHLEYAGMNYELYNDLGESKREWVPFLLAGAGYSQQVGSRTWVFAQILFDVLQSDKSPYGNWEPFYSIGVGTGF